MNKSLFSSLACAAALMLAALVSAPGSHAQAGAQAAKPSMAPTRGVDYIVAVVGQELVTAVEVEKRVALVKEEAAKRAEQVPPDAQLRQQQLEALIEERIVLGHARDSGLRVDEPELERAIQSVASQNKMSLQQLRDQIKKDGLDYNRFRAQVKDQMLVERVREREVVSRIKVSETEIDELVAKQNAARGGAGEAELNVAQILIGVPEGADAATLAKQRAKAEAALARVLAKENFATVAREMSEDSKGSEGGEIGLRPLSRLPDAFVAVVRKLGVGEVAPSLLQTGAGFHVLKLADKREAKGVVITNTRARHILMRPTSQSSQELIQRQMLEMKRQVETGARKFEDLAKQHSLDESANQGGDLGFAPPGAYVPEFETALNALKPGAVSYPVVTRFGVHLIQVVERKDVQVDPKQLREQARNALREQRFEQAYTEWIQDLRARAYVEKRDAP